jgi:hypothetical protein
VLIFLMSFVIIPSTIYNGSTPPRIEPVPRIRTLGLLPGAPEFIICTPAALPCKACVAERTGRWFNSSPLREMVAPVKSLFVAYRNQQQLPHLVILCWVLMKH